MYESFWKLSGKPFSQRSELSGFYRSQSHHAALLRLRYGMDNFAGPGLIMGLSGTGKSSLVRVFAAEHEEMRPFVHVVFPALECNELLRLIASELTQTSMADVEGTDQVLQETQKSLRKHAAAGRRPLVCIDDAHLLSDDALQYVVQPLLNLAESDPEVRLSILLAGLPVLSSRLRKVGELAERIAVTTPLSGFTAKETADFVQGRLEQVNGRSEIFTADALQRLFEVTAGNPRRINRLCDMALLVGFAEQLDEITEVQIDAVGAELLPAAA
jgi:type II secretory pathway predicted ATPase ExeA